MVPMNPHCPREFEIIPRARTDSATGATMGHWPQSRARQWRKFWVALYGRRSRGRRPQPEPSYRRPSLDDRLAIWRCGLSRSAREIGRLVSRDHHTVLRHRQVESGEALALELALFGRESDAREMLVLLRASDEFKAEVERCIQTAAKWRAFERKRVNALTPQRRIAS